MRKIIIFLGVVLSVLFVSCDRFLEHSDKDLIIPETAEQYRQLLIGEGANFGRAGYEGCLYLAERSRGGDE